MKRRFLFLTIVLLLTAMLFAGCAVRSEDETSKIKLYNPSGEHASLPSEITVKNGETFMVKLKSNPTTGYTWEIAIADESVLRFDDETFVVDDPDATGSGGMGTYTFTALKKGQTTLTLDHGQQWEGGNKDKTITIPIIVE